MNGITRTLLRYVASSQYNGLPPAVRHEGGRAFVNWVGCAAGGSRDDGVLCALEGRLKAKDAEPRCGLIVVDTATGATVSWLRFNHTVDELYDVAVLAGVRQAEAIGFKGDTIQKQITI